MLLFWVVHPFAIISETLETSQLHQCQGEERNPLVNAILWNGSPAIKGSLVWLFQFRWLSVYSTQVYFYSIRFAADSRSSFNSINRRWRWLLFASQSSQISIKWVRERGACEITWDAAQKANVCFSLIVLATLFRGESFLKSDNDERTKHTYFSARALSAF